MASKPDLVSVWLDIFRSKVGNRGITDKTLLLLAEEFGAVGGYGHDSMDGGEPGSIIVLQIA